ncbi:MAG: glycine--tRNA ligase subunit beta [Rickettsiaceae bacterium]|jgi:glycyl-tRNA synthetase beta chain|nr:glycine--tRNA ligase subunit beta [Rickettsiaceae bacterium]
MAELLLELFSEEIPAGLQIRAMEEFKTIIGEKLAGEGLEYKAINSYASPRRLAIVIDGLPEVQKDSVTEKRGPRTDAPQPAIDGFLKSSVLSLSDLEKRKEDKGEFYFAVIKKQGRAVGQVLTENLQNVITSYTWAKSMRWNTYNIRWVRPLHNILAIFNGEVLPIEFGYLKANNKTRGHRFLGGDEFTVKNFADYQQKLRNNSSILDIAERKEIIMREAEKLAKENGATLKPDEKLLDEVAGLIEWPVPLLGSIEQRFLDVPKEVLITAMRSHQKYFSMTDSKGGLAPYFITVANMTSPDGGKKIISGNERVLRARLEDAKFFWDNDRKVSLESRAVGLDKIVFHAKIGTVAEKISRMAALASLLCKYVPGSNPAYSERAAKLCKADLLTQMVGEFPELQGLMGGYYATENGEKADVASAIKEHYSPQGPNDTCPSQPTSITVALADKIDTLIGLFAADEKPTGSKDPYALRRAALGVIRIILENNLRLPLKVLLQEAMEKFPAKLIGDTQKKERIANELLEFLTDRLRVVMKEQSIRHDLINAVASGGHEDDLHRLVARAKALDSFLKTEDGANLSAAYKRATNIVLAEEKKDSAKYAGEPDKSLLQASEESELFKLFSETKPAVDEAFQNDNFAAAMQQLARLREPVDSFFEKVTVNCEDKAIRKNRLLLLSQFRASLNKVADFALIEG